MSVSTEIVRRVYNDEEGVFLEVGPGPDGFGVAVESTSDASNLWFGRVSFHMSCAMAASLGEALIAASKECEG